MTPLSTSSAFQIYFGFVTHLCFSNTPKLFQGTDFHYMPLHKPKGLVHCAHLVTVQLHEHLTAHCSPLGTAVQPTHLLLVFLPLANYNYVPVLWPLDRSFILQVANLLSYEFQPAYHLFLFPLRLT